MINSKILHEHSFLKYFRWKITRDCIIFHVGLRFFSAVNKLKITFVIFHLGISQPPPQDYLFININFTPLNTFSFEYSSATCEKSVEKARRHENPCRRQHEVELFFELFFLETLFVIHYFNFLSRKTRIEQAREGVGNFNH